MDTKNFGVCARLWCALPSDHVANFDGDRPKVLGDRVAKKK